MPNPYLPPVLTDPRHQLGLETELRVGRWLTARGWRIVAHRFKLGRHDLDLIARQGPLVAFIEVKARRHPGCGAGEESVPPRKRATLERLAWAWILRHGDTGEVYRFDVAAVRGHPGHERIRYIANAWTPGWR